MPTPQTAAPWRTYLLIDPTTGPSNHALGTIFYVGLRHELPQPVDLREATAPESLPEGETKARERLAHLNREGVRVIVEVVPEQGWSSADSGHLGLRAGELPRLSQTTLDLVGVHAVVPCVPTGVGVDHLTANQARRDR